MNKEHFAGFVIGIAIGYIYGINTKVPLYADFVGFIIGAILVYILYVDKDK